MTLHTPYAAHLNNSQKKEKQILCKERNCGEKPAQMLFCNIKKLKS